MPSMKFLFIPVLALLVLFHPTHALAYAKGSHHTTTVHKYQVVKRHYTRKAKVI